MKKVLSLLLAVIMTVSCLALAFSASAAEAGTLPSNAIVLTDGEFHTKYWTSSNYKLNCYNKITVPARGYITLTLEKPFDDEGEMCSYDLILVDENGKNVWSCDTRAQRDSFSEYYVYKVGLNKGTYYLNIDPSFYVYSDSAPIPSVYKYDFTANNYWEIEPNGAVNLATEIELNKTYHGVYCEEDNRVAYQDWFSVKLTAGKTYKITLGNLDELAKNAIIYLIDPNSDDSSLGSYLKYDGKYDGTAKYIAYKAETTGTYYIKIYNSSNRIPVEYTINIRELHVHSYKSKVTKAATCAKAGVMTYTCSCGKSYTKSIPATGNHTNKTTTTKATATKDGKKVTACTVCGKVSGTTTIYKASSVKLSKTSYTYNGKVQKPTVTVKNSKGKTLKNGTDYTVSYASGCKNTGKYAVKITFKGNYSGTKTLYFNILPSKTSKLSVSQTTTSIKATWKSVTGASGYKVTLYNSKGKAIKKVYTTKTTISFTKLSKGTIYKVRVTAYKAIDGKKVTSSVYKQLTTATKPAAPTIKSADGYLWVTLEWNKVSGADGYEIYMAKSKDGSYKKVDSSYETEDYIFDLNEGKTYYFKVRAYIEVNDKKIYSDFSPIKSVKVT